MWRLIYNLLIHASLPFFLLFSLTQKKIRKNFRERLLPAPAGGRLKNAVWLHAASVGEAIVAETFINYARPRVKNGFIITTNTHYTRDLLRRKFKGSLDIFSLPFDLPYSLKRFIGSSTPAALLLVETEIWPNLIWTARRMHIPVLIINGRISDATLGRYRHLSFFLRHLFSSVDLVLAQSETQAQRFVSLGMPIEKVAATGNLKYYRETKDLPPARLKENIVVFGSIREKELPILIPVMTALREEFPHLSIFVAPRELTLVAAIERQLPDAFAVTRYSTLKESGAHGGRAVVLVDTVGVLVALYARSLVAFVGGSLAPYGGQNLLEPLFVATPVIFGPHVENFREIADEVMAQGAGFMVEDGPELLGKIRLVLSDAGLRKALVDAGRRVLEKQRNVMEKTTSLVLETIGKNPNADTPHPALSPSRERIDRSPP
jgi:3-deoxy-D-manno-octulosonic-acid transferase